MTKNLPGSGTGTSSRMTTAGAKAIVKTWVDASCDFCSLLRNSMFGEKKIHSRMDLTFCSVLASSLLFLSSLEKMEVAKTGFSGTCFVA